MCLGGIMGALECAVDENTRNVVIEAANFDFASIRRTSIRLALTSDSSMRFVKGINPNQYEYVQNMTAQLLIELCEAEQIGDIHNYLKKEYVPTVVETSVDYINGRLGTDFYASQVVKALESAFIEVKEKGDKLVCLIPDWRIDITGEADLSEEVVRILGFEHVKSALPCLEASVGALEENLAKKRMVRSFLRGLGLDEQLTYSLLREKETQDFAILNKESAYKVMNPLTDEHEYVRTNLLPSLMNVLTYNVNHKNNDLAFFEVSDLFSGEHNKHIHLAVILSGNDLRRSHLSGEEYSFFHMKGIAEGILKLFNIDEKRYTFERAKAEEFHPGKSANIKVDGKVLAVLGELHPNTLKKYDLNTNVIAMEMDLDVLFAVRTSMKKMEVISKFPSVKRDFAVILKDDVSANQVVQEIKKVNRELIKAVDIFDVYRGEHIKEGYYSLALSVTISSMEKTLTDNEIASLQESIINALALKLNAELRK
jgi:phenylalanyl-tRNA synthetase beta chain